MSVYDHDASLPSLPIPSLRDTAMRLRSSLEPITGGGDLRRAGTLLDDLSSELEDGARLQELLLDWSRAFPRNQSWLRFIWDDMYLCFREPLPINMNYCFQLTAGWEKKGLPLFIAGLCRVIESLRDESLPPERSKNGFLSMEALEYTIYTRIPGHVRDSLYFPRISGQMTAAVVCKGHWHILSLCGADGKSLSPSAISRALEEIRASSQPDVKSSCVGAMTCVRREEAFRLRSRLSENILNRSNLDSIEKSMFVICLDDEETYRDKHGYSLICGSPKNRWFDKSMQIISSPNGRLGVNFEHSGCDAAIWVYLISLADAPDASQACETETEQVAHYRTLKWAISDCLHEELERASDKLEQWAASLSFAQARISSITKGQVIALKHSPDFFAQTLFQMAYYKMTGKLRSVYEAASSRGFYQGRTECIRPLTNESAEFVRFYTGGGKSDELKKLFKMAELAHKNNLKNAGNGLGAERHMTGLMAMYEMYSGTPGFEDLGLPGIFEDSAYLNLRHDALSTSSVTAPFMDYFGFGPVVPDGIGIGYGMEASCMSVMVSAYEASGINAEDYIGRVELCAAELMRDLR